MKQTLLQLRRNHLRAIAKRELVDGLKDLLLRGERALQALTAGEKVDEHLIANRVSLTADISRWNLMIDLSPMIDEEE
jgi:hypothetical protein